MVAKKHNFGKEGQAILNWWPPKELKERFQKTCDELLIGYGDILTKLVKDFCDGKIYDLPSWEPIDKTKLVHYKDDDGRWIYITPQEFFERLEQKNQHRVMHDPEKEGENGEQSDG